MSVDINTLLTAQSDIHLHGKINVKLEEDGYSKPHLPDSLFSISYGLSLKGNTSSLQGSLR